MGAAIALGDVVGEAQHLLVVAVVPLHGHFDTDLGAGDAAIGFSRAAAFGVEHGGVQHFLGAVDELDKALHAAGAREIVFLAVALVLEADAHPVVQEGQLAQALGQHFVAELVVFLEDFLVGQEVHFGAALLGRADDAHGRDLHAPDDFDQTVLHKSAREVDLVHLAFAAHDELELDGQRVHAGNAHAVQTARDLVAVLVELAARMQLGQCDFSGRALGLMLVIHLHAGGNAAAVVHHRQRAVGMDGHQDVVAIAGQGLVNGVVHHFEHEVVQAGAVRGIADVHARAFAHSLQPFQDLDGAFAIAAGIGAWRAGGLFRLVFCGHEAALVLHWQGAAPCHVFESNKSRSCAGLHLPAGARVVSVAYMRIGMTTYLKVSFSGLVISAELLLSAKSMRTMSWPMLESTSIR